MQVYALVGPSGTGKSHRATVIAHDHQIDLIIDDGLLIQGSRILGGVSAKRQATRIGAIRAAIFNNAEHQREAIELIERNSPQRLLILGTSLGMVERIRKRLSLPPIEKTILIQDVATPEDMRLARQQRLNFGQHVIPAPTLEVKSRFSGALIKPLYALFHSSRHHPSDRDILVEQTIVRPTFSMFGRFLIGQDVIRAIAVEVARRQKYVKNVLRCQVHETGENLELQLDLAVEYGVPVIPVAQAVQLAVKQLVEYMTALHLTEVKILVRKLVLPVESH